MKFFFVVLAAALLAACSGGPGENPGIQGAAPVVVDPDPFNTADKLDATQAARMAFELNIRLGMCADWVQWSMEDGRLDVPPPSWQETFSALHDDLLPFKDVQKSWKAAYVAGEDCTIAPTLVAFENFARAGVEFFNKLTLITDGDIELAAIDAGLDGQRNLGGIDPRATLRLERMANAVNTQLEANKRAEKVAAAAAAAAEVAAKAAAAAAALE